MGRRKRLRGSWPRPSEWLTRSDKSGVQANLMIRRFPIGRERSDPDHLYLTVMKGEAMPKYSELANFGRGEMDW
jgi:hypothetical protein